MSSVLSLILVLSVVKGAVLPIPSDLDDIVQTAYSAQLRFNYYFLGPLQPNSPLPFMHNLMFRLRGIPGMLSEPTVPSENPEYLFNRLVQDPAFRGALIALPLREPMTQFILSERGVLNPLAKMSRSVNTVVRRLNGELVGFNSDVEAMRNAIDNQIRRFGAREVTSVLVLGTGETARSAISAALITEGITRVSVIGLDESRVEPLLTEYALTPYSEGFHYSVLIGCVDSELQIPLMERYPGLFQKLERDSTRLTPVVIDMAYMHAVTPLVQWALGAHPSREIQQRYKFDRLLLYVMRSVVAQSIWTNSLIQDGEIAETPLIKAEVDIHLITSKVALFTSKD